MSKTLLPNDIVLVKKYFNVKKNHNDNKFEHDDLLIFKNPAQLNTEDKLLLKRVIGIPGDTVQIYIDRAITKNNNYVKIFPNNLNKTELILIKELRRDYLLEKELFLCGDNWYHSYDSRIFGKINYSSIYGKVVLFINHNKLSS